MAPPATPQATLLPVVPQTALIYIYIHICIKRDVCMYVYIYIYIIYIHIHGDAAGDAAGGV